ncbi:protein EXPORTIN 1A-like [Rhodamnia argentea]|uniref:Protein EXPORTIN 1A-like n=1 Tax=Rhodamnia argentea TaxID=178133 RepID=A0ABM3H4P4_9MYRT|nr:protein EXPORTIN 1A-like [Rhodamnia argentea]
MVHFHLEKFNYKLIFAVVGGSLAGCRRLKGWTAGKLAIRTGGGSFVSKSSFVKLLRSVKRGTLKLIETFLDKAEDQPQIGKQFVPPMMAHILRDYVRNVPYVRESKVLSLFATIINKYKSVMIEDVPRIFEAIFQCTLEMITKIFEDYPKHRLKFFSLLRDIAAHCFSALIRLLSQQLNLVMDSIIWGFWHTEKNIAKTGLNLLLEMLKNFQASEFCNQFYRTYFLTIEQEIFAVLMDTFHKPGFKLHVLVLQHLFCLVESGALMEPLWYASTVHYPYPNNAVFVREYTIKLLGTSFPNMTVAEIGILQEQTFTACLNVEKTYQLELDKAIRHHQPNSKHSPNYALMSFDKV